MRLRTNLLLAPALLAGYVSSAHKGVLAIGSGLSSGRPSHQSTPHARTHPPPMRNAGPSCTQRAASPSEAQPSCPRRNPAPRTPSIRKGCGTARTRSCPSTSSTTTRGWVRGACASGMIWPTIQPHPTQHPCYFRQASVEFDVEADGRVRPGSTWPACQVRMHALLPCLVRQRKKEQC